MTDHRSKSHTQTGGPNVVNVIGYGVGALLTVSEFLMASEERDFPVEINWVVAPELGDGASPSGGWFQLFHMNDPRAEDWALAGPDLWKGLVRRFPELVPYVTEVPTIMTSMEDSVELPPAVTGDVVELDPEEAGLPHFTSAVLITGGIVIDTIGILPVWRQTLRADSRVATVEVSRISGLDEVAAFATLFGAAATVAAVGMGARAWGDYQLEGVLGWLIIAPPVAPVLGRRHTLMYDGPDVCSYCIPRRFYSVWGGTLSNALDIFGDTGVDLQELTQPRTGSSRERELDDWVRRDAARGRVAAIELWPNAYDVLSDPDPLRIWYSLRPFRPLVMNNLLDRADTYGQRVWMLNGLAGAGWTIGPGVVAEMVQDVFDSVLMPHEAGRRTVRDVGDVTLSDVDRPATPPDDGGDGGEGQVSAF